MQRQSRIQSTARSQGWTHTRARTAALHRLRDGDPCHFCGAPMFKADARWLDYDHDPLDPTRYRGLTHRHCNRSDGATRGNQARHTTRARRATRAW